MRLMKMALGLIGLVAVASCSNGESAPNSGGDPGGKMVVEYTINSESGHNDYFNYNDLDKRDKVAVSEKTRMPFNARFEVSDDDHDWPPRIEIRGARYEVVSCSISINSRVVAEYSTSGTLTEDTATCQYNWETEFGSGR